MDNHGGPLKPNPDPAQRQARTAGRTATNATRRATRTATLLGSVALACLLALSPAGAQGGCTTPERNMQCTEFGTIAMDSQRDIRGQAIDVSADITLNTGYEAQGARWLLFSVRNIEADGSNPVTVGLNHFTSTYGDIVTTRVEHSKANELDLWVDILDTPVGTPIDLQVNVGSTERGAFRLETLVMAFDRGYAPILDSQGNDASLFSFTLLGVNDETGAVSPGGDSLSDGKKLPGPGLIPVLAAMAAAVVLVGRRLR